MVCVCDVCSSFNMCDLCWQCWWQDGSLSPVPLRLCSCPARTLLQHVTHPIYPANILSSAHPLHSALLMLPFYNWNNCLACQAPWWRPGSVSKGRSKFSDSITARTSFQDITLQHTRQFEGIPPHTFLFVKQKIQTFESYQYAAHAPHSALSKLNNLILQQLKQWILWLFYEIRWPIEIHKPLSKSKIFSNFSKYHQQNEFCTQENTT